MTAAGEEPLIGAAAFAALQRQLLGEEPLAPKRFSEPALRRLAAVWEQRITHGVAQPRPMDLAVLVRQVLRFEELRTASRDGTFLRLPAEAGLPGFDDWDRVGVQAQETTNGFLVRALSWRPGWLPNVPAEGADASAAAEWPRRPDLKQPGDPFLTVLSRHHYRSPGQRSAVRAALTAPPGSTLLVCLPTGDGKSFVFQMLSQMGFDGSAPGVTMVVVPTTALALDQERAAHELGICPGRSLTYRGDVESGAKREIIDAIASGTQQLCFASPEAVTGPLRHALLSAARTGLLNALVVDEAHMVETWGTDFRSSFQVLPGVLQAILREAGGQKPRTLLLSATLTHQSVSTLRALFGTDADGNDRFAIYAAPYLRPEIEYWVAPQSSPAEREERLLEAVFHVPRPAIIYTSKVSDANGWLRRLQTAGFGRVAAVTSKTSTAERQAVVEAWSAGKLDLVVGTSAFGMGVDNAHVRSVIHACIPETLDRFYQEVGRGGRDGSSSLSLSLPAFGDLETARTLNRRLTISVKLGLERWRAMFRHLDHQHDEATNTHLVRLDVPPGYEPDRMDMENARNTEWHIRTLTVMAGAGLIQLLGPESHPSRQDRKATAADWEETERELPMHPFQRVRILDPRHLEESIWQERVEPYRQVVAASNDATLAAMQEFLKGSQCAADLIGPVYDLVGLSVSGKRLDVKVARNCGGCPYCRANGLRSLPRGAAGTSYPWPAEPVTRGPGLELLDVDHHVVIFYPSSSEELTATMKRRFAKKVADLMRGSAVHNLIAPPGAPIDGEVVQKVAQGWPIFWSDQARGHGLPPGPTVVVMPPGQPVSRGLLAPCPPGEARFLFLSRETEDPDVPGVLLYDRYSGRRILLDQLR